MTSGRYFATSSCLSQVLKTLQLIMSGHRGIAYKYLGNLRRAIEFSGQRLEVALEIGDRKGERAALGNLGNVYKNLGEPRRAIEFHEQSILRSVASGEARGPQSSDPPFFS
jgi:hypothetical protein